jgi:hypothetical protein
MILRSDHPLAPDWDEMLHQVGTDLRLDATPWQIHPFSPAPNRLREVPGMLGPLVYAVPNGTGWYYVGQTRQFLRQRMTTHLLDPDRAARWPGVMTIALLPEISANRLDELEHIARQRLRPRMGSRWPALR